MLRYSPPGRERMLQCPRLDVWVGGAEANVATQIARFGSRAGFVSALPPGPLADAALFALRGNGVEVDGVVRRPGRMGLYYVTAGSGMRATEVLYDRTGTAFATAPGDMWVWDDILQDANRLHLSGITPALGARGTSAALAAARAAQRLGVPVSFDGNFRTRLWNAWHGTPERTLPRLAEQADILFADHRDISLLLGAEYGNANQEDRRAAAKAALARFPGLSVIACTIRQVRDADSNSLAARIDMRDRWVETEPVRIDAIVDRIGAGDAFAAGVLYGLRAGKSLEETAAFALTTSVLKHSTPGDAGLSSVSDVVAAMGSEFDVRR